MTASGACEQCAAPILAARGHCVICGHRAGVPSPAPAAARRSSSRRGIPVRPQAAIFAGVLTFGFGSLIGAGIGPSVDGVLAAASPLAADQGVPPTDVAATATPGGRDGAGAGPSDGGEAPAPTPVVPSTPVPAVPIPEVPEPTEPPAEDPDDPTEPPAEEETVAQGVVVRVNENADSYSIASGGLLSTVHAEKLPDPGTEVRVGVQPLFNGTLEEVAKRRAGRKAADTATFSGTVTWLAPDGGSYVLSSSGASVPVVVPPAPAGKPPELPRLASSVTVTVDLDIAPPQDPERRGRGHRGTAAADADPGPRASGCASPSPQPEQPIDPGLVLMQRSYEVEFEDLAAASAEGIVQVVCAEESEIVISADDLRESAADMTLSVPDEIDPSRLTPGDSVLVNLDPAPDEDGTRALTGLAGDTGIDGADDAKLGQGDLARTRAGG